MGKATFQNLSGQTFGYLTVESRAPNKCTPKGAKCTMWNCVCICGKQFEVHACALKSGNTTSCGCEHFKRTRNRMTTHGMSKTGAWRSWQNIRKRCMNPDYPFFENYGGRGITVCERWKESFENFFSDMGPRPQGMSIERMENDSGYSPDNCFWASDHTQRRNKRTTRMLTVFGKTMCMADWAKNNGLRSCDIFYRLKKGWTLEDAVSTKKSNITI